MLKEITERVSRRRTRTRRRWLKKFLKVIKKFIGLRNYKHFQLVIKQNNIENFFNLLNFNVLVNDVVNVVSLL